MKKRVSLFLVLILGLVGIQSIAFAQYYEGNTVALKTQTIQAESSATVLNVEARVGDTVSAGDVLASLQPTSVYAPVDGTVSVLYYEAGDEASDTVMQITPQSTYLIYCTADEAYDEPENQHLIAGETLYVKCTVDGTHRAVGRVIQIDGAEYRLETTGGRLYVGETVYLYRSESMKSSSRVGIGTVVNAEEVSLSATGTILEMKVSEGDTVEKGQLLFTWLSGDSSTITAPEDGIISSLSIRNGDTVQEGAAFAEMVRYEDIGLEVILPAEDIGNVKSGQKVSFTYRCDPTEKAYQATVLSIYSLSEEDGYRVILKPEQAPDRLGLSVEVQIEP